LDHHIRYNYIKGLVFWWSCDKDFILEFLLYAHPDSNT
jgi:hypothetical protein